MTGADYRSITTLQAFPAVTTQAMFDGNREANERSPIDVFISDTDEINKLYLSYAVPGSSLPVPLGSLVLLGYTSAVESYFRSVVRRTVLIDDIARRKAEPLTLSFGAALHHKQQLLPEALLEGFSFAGRKGIVEALKEVLDIKLEGNDIEAAMDEFARVCEIRHCCVHRSGRLGSRNAMKLGLNAHSQVLEKPFRPTIDDLELISDLLRTFVKTVNNYLFATVLERTVWRGGDTTPDTSHTWQWKWGEDSRFFKKYYGVYASLDDSPPSPQAREVYQSFARYSGPGGEHWLEKRREKDKAAKAAATPAASEPTQ